MPEVIEALVDGGAATAGPPLGPALGPLGVNIMAVVKVINEKTSAFKGMKVPVRVMIDPKRIMKPEKVVDRIAIYKTFLLKREPEDRFVARSLDPEEAVEMLRKAPEQWYNNYLITYGKRKEERRAELFRKLFEMAEPYVINVIAEVEKVRGVIIKILES